VRALARLCTRAGKEKKYIRGYDGRRIHFELDPSGEIMEEHKGLNKLIQYGAAWQTKTALVALDVESFPLQLTVHDEFAFSTDSDDEARRMAEIMCGVVQLRVPTRVDVKKGSSYGDLTALCTVTSNDLKKEAA
jgi:DNA polymerase I-like protein with 3'-5' exonuclease and polymerase domains